VVPFEQVVREHAATVLRVCRAVVGPVDAEDAWSETFLSALQAYPQLEPGANVEAWLVTIAHRKAIDLHRATARRPGPVDRLHEPAASPSSSRPVGSGEEPTTPEGSVEDAELWAAVGRLPAKQRHTVAYHYLAGLPHREVAAIVGGTEAAARRASADGIASLRRSYVSGDRGDQAK
jgi:RNA polymerase sigma factor (sigma-70 family)